MEQNDVDVEKEKEKSDENDQENEKMIQQSEQSEKPEIIP